jgi:CelD/BcsL family acetyltransferase involved in cellulose biosynthesis
MSHAHTTIARSISEMDRLAPLWKELLAQQPHSIFQRFEWNRLAADVFSDRMTPHVICVESDGGAAIIPKSISHATGQSQLIGEVLFDYRDVLHVGDQQILHRAWRLVADEGEELRVIAVEQEAATKRWADLPMRPFANAPWVDRRVMDEQQFRRAHPRAARQFRRLERLGLKLNIFLGSDGDAVHRLYRSKGEQEAAGDNLFRDPRRQQFMVAAAAMEGKNCQLYTLEASDGSMIAGIVTFRDCHIRRFYTIYFDPAWARFSPGVALVFEATARSLAEGLHCDYMTGEYPYKLRFANASRPLYQLALDVKQLSDLFSSALSAPAA